MDGKTDQKQTDKEREEKKIFFFRYSRSQYYHYETFRRTGKINMRIRDKTHISGNNHKGIHHTKP